MVTLKSVFIDVELVDGYYGFISVSENPDPFDFHLSDLTTETEFQNTLQLIDNITPKVTDIAVKNFEKIRYITFNMAFDCSISERHIVSDTLVAPSYTKI